MSFRIRIGNVCYFSAFLINFLNDIPSRVNLPSNDLVGLGTTLNVARLKGEVVGVTLSVTGGPHDEVTVGSRPGSLYLHVNDLRLLLLVLVQMLVFCYLAADQHG